MVLNWPGMGRKFILIKAGRIFSSFTVLFLLNLWVTNLILGITVPMPKKFLSGYLYFTRKERMGIIVVIVLIIFFTALPFLYPYFISSKPVDHSAFKKEIAAIKWKPADSTAQFSKQHYDGDNYRNYYSSPQKKYYGKEPAGELFPFDPNALSDEGWKKLGIRDRTVTTIRNYLSKGGKFRQPEDIGKIWGLHEDEVRRLLPYINIPPTATTYADNKNADKRSFPKKEYKITPVDINTGDTSAFIALPGIGSKLANRIVAFRDKLGGFYKIEQVGETFALPDSTFQKIRSHLLLTNREVKKLNINTASVDELKIHPYIRYALANAIIQYRTQHGKFLTVNDIKKIMIVTDDIYNKLEPYLSVQ